MYPVVMPCSVTWPVKVPTSPGGSTSVPTARNNAAPCAERMSQMTPSVMTVKVESSPGTANGSTNRTVVEMVAVAGPPGEVPR